MRTEWSWPTWAGAAGGLIAAVAVSFLLRQGTAALTGGLRGVETVDLRTGMTILLAAGILVGVSTVLPRLHPLLPGIPAAWFVVVYVPALFTGGPVDWYPSWMINHFMLTASAGPFLVTGVLVVATATSLFRWDSRLQRDEAHEEAVAGQ